MSTALLEPDEIVVDDATRREFLTMIGAAGLLAACGGEGGGTAAPPPSGPGSRTVTNQFGTFELPAEPKRVIGWEGRRDLETALALGLKPIAVGSNAVKDGMLAPFIPFDLAGVATIQQTEPNLELIASLRPDLILTRDSNIEELVDKLRPLAPLVPVKPDGPWRADLEAVAAVLGRTGALATTLAAYDKRKAEVQARHQARLRSAVLAVVQFDATERKFYGSSTSGFYLQANTIAELGGTQLAFLEQGGEALASDGFSAEQTDKLAGADAIVAVLNTAEEQATLAGSALWQQLPAVKAKRVVETTFRTNYGSVFAATACLDLLDRAYQTLA